MNEKNAAAPSGKDGTASFASLGVGESLVRAAAAAGMTEPKPIQRLAIPPHLAGRDIMGLAQTGSGKTAAFALPILSRIMGLGDRRPPRTARVLVLAPTRELAVQIEETFRLLSRGAHVSTALVLGGVSRASQVKRLRPGVDILVATPGRLTDLVRGKEVDLSATRWLVLDEADRMLDMGFIRDVRRIAEAVHDDCQTAMFSATMPPEVAKLAESLLDDPVRVEAAPQGTAAGEIEQKLILARTRQKRDLLSRMLSDEAMRSVLVFSRTKHGADRIVRDLHRDGIEAAVIHGNKSQNARQKALNSFREGTVRILVATDIAARGIDVPGISHVVNFDLPDEAESYVHRIGRTGRNGASGTAVTLCDPSETSRLRAVEKIMRRRIEVVADHLGEPDPVQARRPEAANDRGAPSGAESGRTKGNRQDGTAPQGVARKPGSKGKSGSGWARKPGAKRRRGSADRAARRAA
jgi:ATP-dependent RNA helicase RhlE